jgi:GcrA cell cycle regulator
MKRSPAPPRSGTPKVKRHSAPGAELVTTATLTARTCKWPIGDPGNPDFHYCGDQTVLASPYCDLHDKRGYQPLAPQRSI